MVLSHVYHKLMSFLQLPITIRWVPPPPLFLTAYLYIFFLIAFGKKTTKRGCWLISSCVNDLGIVFCEFRVEGYASQMEGMCCTGEVTSVSKLR